MVIEFAKKIESLKNNLDATALTNAQNEIDKLSCKINELIYNLFSLNDVENTLVDYGKNFTIPLIMKHKGYEKIFFPYKYEDKILEEYANLFVERFKSSFVSIGKKFVVEIWHTQQVIGMFFKVVPESEYEKDIVWKDMQKDISGLFQTIIRIGTEKVTDKLFIQKDIRGFEKEYFYVFKPNEKRLWHKATGYLDVFEFTDAILKAGRDGK